MKIAINGFGRIGRNVFKLAFEDKDIEIVAINDLTNAQTLAHLLKYDSAYGRYQRKVMVQGDSIIVDDQEIKIYSEKNPQNLPWKKLNVDVVIEATGVFREASSPKGGYKDHIIAGAKKVILTVPAKDKIDQTIVLGVNDKQIDKTKVAFSNASCTTNCLAPIAKILNDNFKIINGFMTTVHAYTNDQVVLDMPHKDLRRARSCATSIIPTTTGATKAVEKVIPELLGKLDGMSMRVPVITGSIVDFVANLQEDPSIEEINASIKKAAEGDLKGIVEYCTDPIVSVDIIKNSHSAVFDSLSTMKVGKGFVKVIIWYDNEWGYSNRVVELAKKII